MLAAMPNWSSLTVIGNGMITRFVSKASLLVEVLALSLTKSNPIGPRAYSNRGGPLSLRTDPTVTVAVHRASRAAHAQRLTHWKLRRAFARPGFFRSTMRSSRRSRPADLSRGRWSGSNSCRARAMPWRSAWACPAAATVDRHAHDELEIDQCALYNAHRVQFAVIQLNGTQR